MLNFFLLFSQNGLVSMQEATLFIANDTGIGVNSDVGESNRHGVVRF